MILATGSLIYRYIRYRLKNILKKEEDKTRINKIIAEYRMIALRAQMNPHFIFNAINSIQNFILDKNTQEAYDYLAKFAKLMRLVLNNAQEQTLTLEKEIEVLLLYIELEQLRFSNSFDFTIDIAEDIDTEATKFPTMLIQPFVENAIWHGLMPLEDQRKGKISVSISSENDHLRILIVDNGIGRERSQKIKKSPGHKSLGVILSQKRMEVLSNVPEGERASITLTDLFDNNNDPAGTKVEIYVPLQLQ